MLKELISADLKRQYYYSGETNKSIGTKELIRSLMNARFIPVVLIRIAYVLYKKNMHGLAKIVSMINFVLFGIEVATRSEIGKGLYLPHTVGTVIGSWKIGENATIYHGVTLGAKEMDLNYSKEKRPEIGNDVVIGSGAKILGGIKVGNGAKIGANSVVSKNVPDYAVVVGIPGKIIKYLCEMKAGCEESGSND